MLQLLATAFRFFFQAEDGIRDTSVTGVQTCALPICGTVQIQSATADNHLYISSVAPDLVFGNNTTRASATAIGFVGFATAANHFGTGSRSEERRVGKEGRCRWSQDQSIKSKTSHRG